MMNLFPLRTVRLTALWLLLCVPGAMMPAPAAAQTAHLKQGPDGRLTPDLDVGMSPEDQIKIGREAAAQARKQLPMLPDDSPITRYVAEVGRRITAKAPGYKWPWEFHVVNQKEINAFAVPGGPLFVNLGTIQNADEGELAGVMAHEISHVVLQHSAREAAKQQRVGLLGALGAVLAGAVLGDTLGARMAQAGIMMGANGIVMKYSRTAETEADLMGAQLMYDAGYDPASLVEFFDKLKKDGGQGVPEFLSDHPDPGNRAENVQRVIARFPKKQFPRSDSAEFVAMHREAMNIKPYTSEEIARMQKSGSIASPSPQGVAASAPNAGAWQPSRSQREYASGGVRLLYPDNWQVVALQNGEAVIAPREGIVGSGIAYGLSLQRAPASGGASLNQRTSSVLNGLLRDNPQMKALGSPQRIRVNGREGRSVELVGNSPLADAQGRSLVEHDWLVTVDDGAGGAVTVVFIAPDKDFKSLRPAFGDMLRSLRIQ